MASHLLLLLLLLLLMVTSASAWSSVNRYFGGAVTICPKGRTANGTFEMELRSKQGSYRCYYNPYVCRLGDCGYQQHSVTTNIAWDSYGLVWCQRETTIKLQLSYNLPFTIRYPSVFSLSNGRGYWMANAISRHLSLSMKAHVDLGLRSDTKQSNRPPVSTMLPIIRVTRNCPRKFDLNVFDPDGDRVRCRAATNRSTEECGLCGLPSGFSLDQDSCTLQYNFAGRYGYHPIELVLEDFPNKQIALFYTDGSYTLKEPLLAARNKRQIFMETITAGTTTTTTTEVTTSVATTAAPTTTTAPTTAVTTTTTEAPTTIPAAFLTALPPGLGSFQSFRFRSSVPPLSLLPLQFTIQVDSHTASSCDDGDYFPLFVSPTPANGVHLPATVNRTLEFTVRVKAQYTTIYRLLLTGPSGISQRRLSYGHYTVKWTPSERELNCHFPICFVSEAYSRTRRVYHSELRCLTVDVAHYDAVVTCTERTMKVEVEKTFLTRRLENKLHLNGDGGSSCKLTTLSNNTHLVALMSLSSCGTRVEEDKDNIIFRNQITSADPGDIISRQNDVDIAFYCVYPRRSNLTLGFRHKNPYAFKEKGFGSFTFQFEFFEGPQFRQQVDGSTYPVEVYLKQMIYMQIKATSSIPNTELFVESCRATPYDNPESSISYSIIENGCVKDNTVQVYNGSKSQFRFGMEAFEFIGAHDEVYITCSVLLCDSGAPNTRCLQACVPTGSHRSKREAAAQTSNHFVSQGPLHLVKMSESPDVDTVQAEIKASVPGLNLSMNLVFIVGCLLACGVVVYRSRRSRAKYQRLPTSETD